MAKRGYVKRRALEPTFGLTTRVPVRVYERMKEEANVRDLSMSALIVEHLEVLYDEEEYNARMREAIAFDEHKDDDAEG